MMIPASHCDVLAALGEKHGLSPLELQIVSTLQTLGAKAYAANDTDTQWTIDIKRTLSELGKGQGYLVFPNSTNGGHWDMGGEWLFDLVWVDAKRNERTNQLDWRLTRSLKLACESEWGNREYLVLEDFFKLTFVNADLRLFIYTDAKIVTYEKEEIAPADLCRRTLQNSSGARYLLVGFPPEPRQIRIDVWGDCAL